MGSGEGECTVVPSVAQSRRPTCHIENKLLSSNTNCSHKNQLVQLSKTQNWTLVSKIQNRNLVSQIIHNWTLVSKLQNRTLASKSRIGHQCSKSDISVQNKQSDPCVQNPKKDTSVRFQVWWLGGWYPGLRNEWSGFGSWTSVMFLGKTLHSQCLSPPRN